MSLMIIVQYHWLSDLIDWWTEGQVISSHLSGPPQRSTTEIFYFNFGGDGFGFQQDLWKPLSRLLSVCLLHLQDRLQLRTTNIFFLSGLLVVFLHGESSWRCVSIVSLSNCDIETSSSVSICLSMSLFFTMKVCVAWIRHQKKGSIKYLIIEWEHQIVTSAQVQVCWCLS